jgi:hypothetical protein
MHKANRDRFWIERYGLTIGVQPPVVKLPVIPYESHTTALLKALVVRQGRM